MGRIYRGRREGIPLTAPRSPKRRPIRESDWQALQAAVWVWQWRITTAAAGLCFLAVLPVALLLDVAHGLAVAVLGLFIRACRPGPTAELDDWTGRGR